MHQAFVERARVVAGWDLLHSMIAVVPFLLTEAPMGMVFPLIGLWVSTASER